MKTVGMAADHAGYTLKEELKSLLIEEGYKVEDFGTFSAESMDYPDVAHPLARGGGRQRGGFRSRYVRFGERHKHDSQ